MTGPAYPDNNKTAQPRVNPPVPTGTPAPAWRPDYAVPPGQILREVLAARGISQAELALRTGLSPKHVNQVIKGLVPLSAEMALLLERVLDTPSYVWNGLEAEYRGAAVRVEARKRLSTHTTWVKQFPTTDLITHGVLRKSDDGPTRVEKILSFFGVADPETYGRLWDEPIAVFRRSQKFHIDPYATATWLRLAEIAATHLPVASYDCKAFQRLLPTLRALTIPPLHESFPELQRRCGDAGVAVVRIPQIAGTRACGATRWINATYPIIVLSGRYKMEDSLWFSFFHEAGHVLLHPKRATYIAPDGKGDDKDGLEKQADDFAQNVLIPAELSDELIELTTPQAIKQFASRIGIDTGIVAGRLMTEKILEWSNPGLRRKLCD